VVGWLDPSLLAPPVVDDHMQKQWLIPGPENRAEALSSWHGTCRLLGVTMERPLHDSQEVIELLII
jgi:hypothetical protein